ncbi:hypothetical protein OIDMADRAFT_34627 [Oidiodendron maius Zn]|uniref:Uncharacterized protein n=1 Tax=Oidiodendron maius (strain Zn) TaxID=913774 RepID=A0A0C3CY92_OIDMZ|nr:hypothetical protein OIDMADRAFT_34627 [Oidiodendron maius Zn]
MATSARQATALAVLEPKQQQPATSVIDFDAAKHLNYSPPSSSISMDELHFPLAAISAVDSTQPFPLLSHDAVVEHRRVLFSKPVLENCLYRTRAGSAQLRGMAPHYAPFIYQFWSSPEVLKIISEHAGVKLLPVLGSGGLDAVRNTPIKPLKATPEAIAALQKNEPKQEGGKEKANIIEWHHGSYPFVCVVMLSDARHMSSSETGNGDILLVKAPQMASAIILQGR